MNGKLGPRPERCSRCVCPEKDHKKNVSDQEMTDFITFGKPDPWSCWMDKEYQCKGAYEALQEICNTFKK